MKKTILCFSIIFSFTQSSAMLSSLTLSSLSNETIALIFYFLANRHAENNFRKTCKSFFEFYRSRPAVYIHYSPRLSLKDTQYLVNSALKDNRFSYISKIFLKHMSNDELSNYTASIDSQSFFYSIVLESIKRKNTYLFLQLTQAYTLFDRDYYFFHHFTLLEHAVILNALAIVKILCNEHNLNSVSRTTGRTILHDAAEKGHHDIVLFLTKQPGLLINKRNSKGDNALSLACKSKKYNTVEHLLSHEEINTRFKYNGYTILHLAAQQNSARMAKALIKKDPDLVNVSAHRAIYPINIAIRNRNVPLTKILLDCPKSNPELVISYFKYSRNELFTHKNKNLCRLLLEYEKDHSSNKK